jgi:response regulator RpfG family c-di-GMP phosphodiesterase
MLKNFAVAPLRTLVQSIYELQAFCFAAMKATILLIDDYPGISDSSGHSLRLEGCSIAVVSHGQEALNSLRVSSSDLILLNSLPCLNLP